MHSHPDKPPGVHTRSRKLALASALLGVLIVGGAVAAAVQREARLDARLIEREPEARISALTPDVASQAPPPPPARPAGTTVAPGATTEVDPAFTAAAPSAANAAEASNSGTAPVPALSAEPASGAEAVPSAEPPLEGQARGAETAPTDEAAAGAGGSEPSGEACGSVTCAQGKVCCNASCGTCVDPGQKCSQMACGMQQWPASVPCGSNTCNVGEVCCNPSCGICAQPGQACDSRICEDQIVYPESQSCGMSTCNVGTVCCNPSCGICAPPGEACSHALCAP